MDPERQRERGVTRWLQMVRGLLRQAEQVRRVRMNMFGIGDDEVWNLTMRMERMKRDGTWARPIVDEHPRPELARVEGVQDAAEEKKRTDAIDIFPEEVWRKILAKVTDEDDLWNCDHTCQLFDVLLRPWKSGWNLEQALPFIYRHLSKDEILRCRQICKSWRDAIDHYLENHPSLRPHQEEEGYYKRLDFVCPLREKKLYGGNEFRFNSKPNIDNSAILLEERFHLRGQNPFLGRFVVIELGYQGIYVNPTSDQPWDSWFDRFVQFLSKFGKEIFFLCIKFPINPNQFVQEKLASIIGGILLQSTPYLKKLTIDARGETYTLAFLQDELPEAPNLESIEILNLVGVANDHIFYSLIQKYGPQLGKLHIDFNNFTRLSWINFSNLKELTLEIGKSNNVSVFSELNARFECRMANLSKVHLVFPIDPRYYLFEDLNSFINELIANTNLNTLRLSGNLEGIGFATDRELDGRLRRNRHYNPSPTSLRSFEIDMDWMKFQTGCTPIMFNFLQPCFPNLVNLAVFARETSPTFCYSQRDTEMEVDLLGQAQWEGRARMAWAIVRANEVVQLHRRMYGGLMYESRVWEVLPDLKVVTVQWRVFTREDYDFYHRI